MTRLAGIRSLRRIKVASGPLRAHLEHGFANINNRIRRALFSAKEVRLALDTRRSGKLKTDFSAPGPFRPVCITAVTLTG